MKVTLDTNVLVSGTFWTGDSFKILDIIDKGKLKHVSSKELIDEYYKAISSDEIIDKIKDKKLTMLKIAQKVISNSQVVEPSAKLNIIKEDSDDNKVLECAKEGKAEYIITNDNHLLKLKEFEGIRIITPAEFFKLIKNIKIN